MALLASETCTGGNALTSLFGGTPGSLEAQPPARGSVDDVVGASDRPSADSRSGGERGDGMTGKEVIICRTAVQVEVTTPSGTEVPEVSQALCMLHPATLTPEGPGRAQNHLTTRMSYGGNDLSGFARFLPPTLPERSVLNGPSTHRITGDTSEDNGGHLGRTYF